MSTLHYYDNIKLLRVFAVISIFFNHFFQRIGGSYWLLRITSKGSLCVELFFVISGFLAMIPFYQRPISGKQILTYYKKRAVRILPVYYSVILYFFITETFIYNSVPRDPTGLGWLRYLFLLAGNVRGETGWFDFWTNLGITWTVFVFATFYFLMPFIGRLITKFWHAVALGVGCYAIRILLEYNDLAYLHTFQYFVFFALGILAFFAINENKQPHFFCLIGVALAINILLQGTVFALNDLMMAGLISSMIIVASEKTCFKNVFCRKAIDLIDEYSYAIYLGQGIVFCGIIDKLNSPNRFLAAAISLFGTVVVAYVLHNGIEKQYPEYAADRDPGKSEAHSRRPGGSYEQDPLEP